MSRKRGSTLSRVARSRHLPSRVAYGRSSFPSRSTTRVENERPSPSGAGPSDATQLIAMAQVEKSATQQTARLKRSRRHSVPSPLEGEGQGGGKSQTLNP